MVRQRQLLWSMHTPLAALVWALQQFRVRKAFKFGGGSNANAGQPARTAAPQVSPVAAAPRALTQAKEVLPRSLDMTRMGPGNPPFQDLQVRSLLGLGTFGSSSRNRRRRSNSCSRRGHFFGLCNAIHIVV